MAAIMATRGNNGGAATGCVSGRRSIGPGRCERGSILMRSGRIEVGARRPTEAHGGEARNIRVLESVSAPASTTKFIDQVVRFAPSNISFLYFGWRAALFSRFDVFHVHWPEFLLRADNQLIAAAKQILFRLFISRLRRRGTPVVRTLHNLHPHTPGTRLEERLLAELDKVTTVTVLLNESTSIEHWRKTLTILHGHYVDVFAEHPRSTPTRGRLVYAGRIEPYKGVIDLLDAFSEVDQEQLSVRIVGEPSSGLGEQITSRIRILKNASAALEFVSDSQMVAEITAAELVVLPYREMHNSGVLLVALSLGKPVLVPRSESNQLLANEVGADWVLQYDGMISAEIIRRGVEDARRTAGRVPDLSRRDWATIASRYADVFMDAISSSHEFEQTLAR
ncbi:glycosyltransferase [Agromyces albus]|uniref:glycosyltransferase n=1 Tax=Agromyces albus TaxID=205332 RepID=UPI002786B227|nr:glycosyltransferase [Agromyces albus]MDQ0574560.1 beta-1,4-mannosyltransferase [Agromyces albus]